MLCRFRLSGLDFRNLLDRLEAAPLDILFRDA